MPSQTFTYNTRGPLFDGSFAREMERAMDEIKQEVGDETVLLIQDRLDQVLVNPTGFYRSNIRAYPRGLVVMVDDNNVIYGPWLEGVGSRNATTRFKGYHTFRTVLGEARRRTPKIADQVIGRYVD